MFDKILIANRGEIACRVARTAKRLGIATVAVYSEADANSLHVQQCDEAYCIGPASASESYLRGDKILKIAIASNAQAIHPGYGFLSENADFARACEQTGIVFIGPPVSAIEAMGSKSNAKQIMASASVPLIPGYHGDDQSDDRLTKESERIGFPQLIKASAGGGGKGMRIVHQPGDFEASLVSARRESLASFSDDRMLIERYLSAPRHIEVQVFADTRDNYVHLFERDCSIQRRHQKIIEEAPAPGMDAELRARMTGAAVDCARAIGYVGAGTVEFLLDTDSSFYFMEMNTRLQVEHPVTEMVTGIDLVQWQLEVAAGLPLPLSQEAIKLTGHAFEARVYAEVPRRDFLPTTGKLEYFSEPLCDKSVRIDTGVKAGDEISTHYDPMIAKLIVHAENRQAALLKMRQALHNYQILGVQTNVNFLAEITSNQVFIDASFDTGFVEKQRDALIPDSEAIPEVVIVLAGLALMSGSQAKNSIGSNDDQSPWQLSNGWRLNQAARHCIRLLSDDSNDNVEYQLDILTQDDNLYFKLGQNEYVVRGSRFNNNRLLTEINAQRYDVTVLVNDQRIQLWVDHQQWCFKQPDAGLTGKHDVTGNGHLVAPMPGNVVAVQVAQGDTVRAGDALMVIEAMKMEHTIVAPAEATVAEVFFAVGDQVEEGNQLIKLE